MSPQGAEDYLLVLLARLDYLRRRAVAAAAAAAAAAGGGKAAKAAAAAQAAAAAALREAFRGATEFMLSSFPDHLDRWAAVAADGKACGFLSGPCRFSSPAVGWPVPFALPPIACWPAPFALPPIACCARSHSVLAEHTVYYELHTGHRVPQVDQCRLGGTPQPAVASSRQA